MSAGSHTEPGGYASPSDAEPQFEISDDAVAGRGGRRAPGRRLRPGLEGLAAGLIVGQRGDDLRAQPLGQLTGGDLADVDAVRS